MNGPDLERTQALFAKALLTPDFVLPTLPLLFRQTGQAEHQTAARLAFYRGNLTAIWSQALGNAYPVLQQLSGTDFFVQMARAYGVAHPSSSGDLNDLGAALAGFLAASEQIAGYPYFVDVAALEWQVHRAYYAADATTLQLPVFLAQAGDFLSEAGLTLQAATQLHESPYATVAIWRAHQSGALKPGAHKPERLCPLPENVNVPNFGLVTRQDWQVAVTPLSRAAYLALRSLEQGNTLGQALECAIEEDAHFDVASALTLWFSAGAFSNYTLPAGKG